MSKGLPKPGALLLPNEELGSSPQTPPVPELLHPPGFRKAPLPTPLISPLGGSPEGSDGVSPSGVWDMMPSSPGNTQRLWGSHGQRGGPDEAEICLQTAALTAQAGGALVPRTAPHAEPAGVDWPSKHHQATHLMLTAPGRAWVAPRSSVCSLLLTCRSAQPQVSCPGAPCQLSQAAKSYRDRPGCHSKATHTSHHCSLSP